MNMRFGAIDLELTYQPFLSDVESWVWLVSSPRERLLFYVETAADPDHRSLFDAALDQYDFEIGAGRE